MAAALGTGGPRGGSAARRGLGCVLGCERVKLEVGRRESGGPVHLAVGDPASGGGLD